MNRRSYDLMKSAPSATACQWSSQSYNLEGITKSFSLPMVIRCDESSGSLADKDLRIKLSQQQILLYATRTRQKMVARHLKYDKPVTHDPKDINTKSAGGEKLIIPEDYPGWFVFLKSTAGGVKCFETVEELLVARIPAFVTGSKLSGLQVTTEPGGPVDYKLRNFLPGTVFRPDKIYIGKRRVHVGKKFLIFRKTKLQDVKYLKCYDVQNREILLNLNQAGKFFEISAMPGSLDGNGKYVFDTGELFNLERIISPVMLIHGLSPRVENFSGILHLERKFLDQTVVAATTSERGQQVVLEIATSSASTFHLALNSKHLIRHGEMGVALKHCKRHSDEFVQKIRVPVAMTKRDAEFMAANDSELGSDISDKVRKLDSISESAEEEDTSETEEKLGDDVTNNRTSSTAESENSPKLTTSEENGNTDLHNSYKEDEKNATDSDAANNNDDGNNNFMTKTERWPEEQVSNSSDENTTGIGPYTEQSDKQLLLDASDENQLENVFDNDVSLTEEQVNNKLPNDSVGLDISCESETDTDEDNVVTITVEEKLIDFSCMSEILLSATTTTEVCKKDDTMDKSNSDFSESSVSSNSEQEISENVTKIIAAS